MQADNVSGENQEVSDNVCSSKHWVISSPVVQLISRYNSM